LRRTGIGDETLDKLDASVEGATVVTGLPGLLAREESSSSDEPCCQGQENEVVGRTTGASTVHERLLPRFMGVNGL